MGIIDSRLITPPSEEEEVYPYRRVWFSIIIENGVLFGATLIVYLLSRFVTLPESLYQPFGIVFALLPAGLWLGFSYLRERRVEQPRYDLLLVTIITGLSANAIGIPLVEDVFQVQSWLALQSAVNRMIGYTFSLGLVQMLIIYIILRYTIWQNRLRIRLDAVAYAVSCAVGYATVMNLHFVVNRAPAPDIVAFRVFDNTSILVASAIVLAYGLAEMRFNRRILPPLVAVTVMLGALISGAAVPFRAGLTNAGISTLVGLSIANPFRGFLLSAVILAGVGVAAAFMFNTTERTQAEAAPEEDEILLT